MAKRSGHPTWFDKLTMTPFFVIPSIDNQQLTMTALFALSAFHPHPQHPKPDERHY
jgi:hypothetical protein